MAEFAVTLLPVSKLIPRVRGLITCLTLVALVACGGSSPTTPSDVPSGSSSNPGTLSLLGDPGTAQGTTWTYVGSVGGTAVDLQGILVKPPGAGPFPAVIISHGAGGNAGAYSRVIATEMVRWGMVTIATNYTHAAGVPLGAPGTADQPGASEANVLRARAVIDILRSLGYVDMGRVAAHGHSMGAFVTSALLAARPDEIRAASHTAGGIRQEIVAVGAAPTEGQARAIRTPYQLHHGDRDGVVPLFFDERLASVLQERGTVHELHVYPGFSHDDVSRDAVVLSRVRAWYTTHGVL